MKRALCVVPLAAVAGFGMDLDRGARIIAVSLGSSTQHSARHPLSDDIYISHSSEGGDT